nr:MAG TPA: hypothetical protein [Caudoviricetes sp.]
MRETHKTPGVPNGTPGVFLILRLLEIAYHAL